MRRIQLKVGFWQDISVVPLKIRQTSSGVHLFDRRTGLNALLEPVSTGLRAPSLALAAVLTARLCNQPLTWANHRSYSAPLHAAQKMDKDHPQYRRSSQGEATDDTPTEFSATGSLDE